MPNIKSAKKRMRSNEKKSDVNTLVTSSMKTAIKKFEKEITKKVESHRDAFYNKLYKEITNYFNTAEISRFNLNRLNIVRKDFHNEAPHRYRENLMSYLDEYESNLLKQEESANK